MRCFADPFQYTPAAAVPILISACSKIKRPTEPAELVRFGDLYDGPTWRDIRASGFPMTNVAAISALYGFLEPGFQVETYDRVMDEKISYRQGTTGNDAWRLAELVTAAPATFVIGGALYRSLAETAIRIRPAIGSKVTFATGSYLAQRKQLGEWLRSQK